MDKKEVYIWASFFRSRYTLQIDLNTINYPIEEDTFNFILPHIKESNVCLEDFSRRFNSFTISKDSAKLIDYLKDKYHITTNNQSLYALAACMQSHFIEIYNSPINPDESWYEAEYDYVEYKKLFELIELHVLGKSNADLESITIKRKQEYKFKSFFIYLTMLDALVEYYGITSENLNEVKERELSNKYSTMLDKRDDAVKSEFITILHSYIKSYSQNTDIINRDIRFIICFLFASQISINKHQKEVNLPSNISDVSQSDITNVRKYLKGNRKFSHKN